MGLNISAAPSTDPPQVRNISFTRQPCSRGSGKQSKPPVREITCNLPGTRWPSWHRSTAGVVSAKHVRGARREACGKGKYVMGCIKYVADSRGMGDYGRTGPACGSDICD